MDYEIKARTYTEVVFEGELHDVLEIAVSCDNEEATIKMFVENKDNKVLRMKDVFIDDERQ
jgi:hypothetical protein